MESLVEMVQIENSLRNYVNFTISNRFSWASKTLNPCASWDSGPWTPGATMESLMSENNTNLQCSAKLQVNFIPALNPLGLLKC